MKKLFQSIFLAAIVANILIPQKAVWGREFSEDGNNHASSPLVCSRNGDRNRGHGNDPYIEFTMNIEEVGAVLIAGDFDLDNPGASMDKQMEIISEGEKVQWASLNDSQKQQIKDEWARQICLSRVYPD